MFSQNKQVTQEYIHSHRFFQAKIRNFTEQRLELYTPKC